MSDLANQFKRSAEQEYKDDELKNNEHFIGTGSTLLNLALSDRVDGGWLTGHGIHIVGDSGSGKSILLCTAYAEAAHDPWFENHEIEDCDREASRNFDMQYLFGKKTVERLKGVDVETCEDWSNHVFNKLDEGKSIIHGLDSFDALPAQEDIDRERQKAEGKKVSGTYGTGKAKVASGFFRKIVGPLSRTNGIVFIISQTRDDINPMTFDSALNRNYSGGNALKFYGHQRVCIARVGSINKKGREIGSKVRVRVTRTRLTGKVREVDFPVYYDYGIDDIGSMVDFLTIQSKNDDGFWEKKKNTIIAEDLDIEAGRDKIIRTIEDECLEDKVRGLTGELWAKIEESLRLNRKKKYE